MAVIQTFDFSSSTGWTLDSGMVWEIGTPTQITAYDGDCLATDLSANYPDDIAAQSYATSPIIDCSAYNNVTISFRRNAYFENTSDYDTFTIDVYDGSAWQTIWTSDDTTANINDGSWTLQTPSISTYGDENADFQIRFGGESDGSTNYQGWFIDDLIISGDAATNYQIEGVTYDKDGIALGACKVALFKDNTPTDSFSFVDYITSHATTGAFLFENLADNDANYCIRAWKDNTPHIFDVTDYEILPKETPDVSWDLYLRSDADKSESNPDTDLRLRTTDDKLGITPAITNAGDEVFSTTETGLTVTGTGFIATQGTGKLEIGNSSVYASATKVEQTTNITWTDLSINFDLSLGAITDMYLWLFVTNDDGRVSNSWAVTIDYTPTITNIEDEAIANNEQDVVLDGTYFETSQGTGKLEIADSATYATATKVTQTIVSWDETEIVFDVVKGSFLEGIYYVFVTNSLGNVSTGYEFELTLVPPEPLYKEGSIQSIITSVGLDTTIFMISDE